MSKKRKIFLSITIPIISLALIAGILYYFSFFQGWVTVKNGVVTSSTLPKNSIKNNYEPKLKFDKSETTSISDIKISLLGKQLNLKDNIFLKSLRYYIPIDDICSKLNYSIQKDNDLISLKNNSSNVTINLSDNTLSLDGQAFSLRGKHILRDNKLYFSLSDIEKMFNLWTDFNFKEKKINFINAPKTKPLGEKSTDGRAALIRLEDFGASECITNETNRVKFKILGNFLENNGIKFHVAWVPRYKNPQNGVDNNLLTNNSIENIAFINLLDNLIFNGAELGFHGYTHQSGNEVSFSGIEFSRTSNTSEKEIRATVETAIDTASYLNMPVSFFESPHYKATKNQLKTIGEYFQYMFEPSDLIHFTVLKLRGDNLYIPTPLDYVKNSDPTPMIKKINNPNPFELASLFYHPTVELPFINFSFTDKDITINYSKDSPMQKISKALIDNKYVTIHVTDFKPKK